MDLAPILNDLAGEQDALDDILSATEVWTLATPSEGWTIADQISHLQFFDERATMAMVDPKAFIRDRERLIANAPHDASVDLGRSIDASSLLDRWRRTTRELRTVAASVDPASRVPWYGPSMSVSSFVTARLMETWTHGHDVCVASGHPPVITARLRHVAHIGVSARPFSLAINGLPADPTPVRVELRAPDATLWHWGPADAVDRVSGDAYDFCLVVTQRRMPDESGVRVEGASARQWIDVAQAFAGPPRRR